MDIDRRTTRVRRDGSRKRDCFCLMFSDRWRTPVTPAYDYNGRPAILTVYVFATGYRCPRADTVVLKLLTTIDRSIINRGVEFVLYMSMV